MPLSVIICTRNRSEQLRTCLESLAESAILPAEILVIDQSDSGDSAAAAKEMQMLVPRIHYQYDSGRGQARARNIGIAYARAPLVAFTDDDCTVAQSWVGALAEAFESGVDGVLGRTLPGPRGGAPGLTHGGSTHSAATSARFRFPNNPFTMGSGNNMAFRRDLFASIGGFDERLGPGSRGQSADDSELFYRALRAGCTLAYAPDALIYHHSWLDQRTFLRHRYGYFLGAGLFLTSYAIHGDRHALKLLLRRLRWECAGLTWDGVRRRHGPTSRRAMIQSVGCLVGIGAAVLLSRQSDGSTRPQQ